MCCPAATLDDVGLVRCLQRAKVPGTQIARKGVARNAGWMLALVVILFLPAARVRALGSFVGQNPVDSVSGQFAISSTGAGGPAWEDPALAANTNLVRLNPALLAVAAERFKILLWEQLGIRPNASWSGKIYLRLHPARTMDETVTIAATPFLNHWNYVVDLPDQLTRTRYARAMTAVLLLELANRHARPGGHSAELPDWLVDGLAQQMLAADEEKIVLSAPIKRLTLKNNNELAVNRINQSERGFDPLARARSLLRDTPALNFDQLSWPTDAQMNGQDGGLYFASAQLFLSDLLAMRNGREMTQAMLAELPDYLNWQTAFLHAFAADFRRPLDVEKWWALEVVNFAARSPGPRWPTDVSLARMDELLRVPVDYRNGSNALPTYAEISLQSAIQNLAPGQRDSVLQAKARDLAVVELRLAAPFGDLADAYRLVLADFLGESPNTGRGPQTGKNASRGRMRASLSETLKRLDALDIRRRAAETKSVIELSGAPPSQTH